MCKTWFPRTLVHFRIKKPPHLQKNNINHLHKNMHMHSTDSYPTGIKLMHNTWVHHHVGCFFWLGSKKVLVVIQQRSTWKRREREGATGVEGREGSRDGSFWGVLVFFRLLFGSWGSLWYEERGFGVWGVFWCVLRGCTLDILVYFEFFGIYLFLCGFYLDFIWGFYLGIFIYFFLFISFLFFSFLSFIY